MLSPAAPFDAAEEAALRGSAGLQAASGAVLRIYTEIPAKAPMPYVVRGEHEILTEDSGCGVEAEIYTTIHVWSRTEPTDKGAQARAMGAAIIAAMTVQMAVAGWVVDEWFSEFEGYSTDPDQSTHGRFRFRFLLTQAA